jgi:hypothetical protein
MAAQPLLEQVERQPMAPLQEQALARREPLLVLARPQERLETERPEMALLPLAVTEKVVPRLAPLKMARLARPPVAPPVLAPERRARVTARPPSSATGPRTGARSTQARMRRSSAS